MSYYIEKIDLKIPDESLLPDNDQWTNRFEIKSASSNRIYVIAQHKKSRFWGCSCPGWKSHRHCKHLKTIGVPNNMIPMEVQLT